MSYVIQIWENGADGRLPTDIQDALRILEPLHFQKLTAPNPKFAELSKRLLQRYPDIDTAELAEGEDEVDFESLAWIETLNGNTLNAVFAIGLNTNDLFDDARPFLIREANALGLCLSDEQAGEVYLPNGEVLSAFGHPPGAKPVAPSQLEALDAVFNGLGPCMLEHGYRAVREKNRYERIFPNGWCRIELFSGEVSGATSKVGLNVKLHFQPIAELVCKIAHPDWSAEQIAERPTLWVESASFVEGQHGAERGWDTFFVHESADITDIVNVLVHKLRILLTDLPELQTLERYEQLLNPPEGVKYIFRASAEERVVAAYLVGSLRLDAICNALRDQSEKMRGVVVSSSRRVAGLDDALICINYVKKHPLRHAGKIQASKADAKTLISGQNMLYVAAAGAILMLLNIVVLKRQMGDWAPVVGIVTVAMTYVGGVMGIKTIANALGISAVVKYTGMLMILLPGIGILSIGYFYMRAERAIQSMRSGLIGE